MARKWNDSNLRSRRHRTCQINGFLRSRTRSSCPNVPQTGRSPSRFQHIAITSSRCHRQRTNIHFSVTKNSKRLLDSALLWTQYALPTPRRSETLSATQIGLTMSGIARISFTGGARLMPARNGYDRELVFDEAEFCARRHGSARLEFDRSAMLISVALTDAPTC